MHGVYDRATTIVEGQPIVNEDLVNLPNWLVLKLRIEGEETTDLAAVELLDYRHELDTRSGLVSREVRFRDRAQRRTTLRSRRLVSMADPHRGAIEWTLTPENWSGRVQIISGIDGRVANRGVPRYAEFESRHLLAVAARTFGPEVIALKVRTRQSDIHVSQAARTRVYAQHAPFTVRRRVYRLEDYIHQVLTFEVREGEPVRVEKVVAFSMSRDAATGDTLAKAGRRARLAPDFSDALAGHTLAWRELWRACDLRVRGDERVQALLRLNAFHVLQVCSKHTVELDAGAPARGLSGEAYRGHVFWDELWVCSFLNLRMPEVTRALLMYRYRRLEEARAAAGAAGLRGAMFPWQSGSEGTEETQQVHLNPLSGSWEPDLSRNQRHVDAAIFYNIWQYLQATGDATFLYECGAEMMVEIARFWGSVAHFNPQRRRYEIHGVMGPDEFHDQYPGADKPGLRNNAYTNVMVAWLCSLAADVLSALPESRCEALRARLAITDDELRLWEDISRRMFVPFHGEGIISQFEGYEALQELDWDAYRAEYGNIQRLDRILHAEGDDPNRYKVTKQADTVMLFYLFSPTMLRQLFERLGYEYRSDTAARNIAYYDQRTSHGSTLSFVAHAGVLAKLDPASSWRRFLVALRTDAEDIQGGTTREGIHAGVMSGTLDLMQRVYPGIEIREGILHFEPRLPDQIEELSFAMQFRETSLLVTLTANRLVLASRPDGTSGPVRVGVRGEVCELRAGQEASFELDG